jgi:hypothetical protein
MERNITIAIHVGVICTYMESLSTSIIIAMESYIVKHQVIDTSSVKFVVWCDGDYYTLRKIMLML